MLYAKEGQRDLPPFQTNPKLNDPTTYLPSDGLVDAVNAALMLGQPLLLTGEPGTGKTQLAYHIAHYFKLSGGKPLVFNAQTTSTATDLFYRYDTLAHFQYNQNNATPLSIEALERDYIQYQALGEAIRRAQLSGERVAVLIDEIDKAPRDLPNDLLAAIEKLRFSVPEIKKSFEVTSDKRPVIIITSNSEKNLPDAFLRRVVYYHIPFPDAETLLKILNKKFDNATEDALTVAIAHFSEIRDSKVLRLKKNPATAELIYWVWFLLKNNFDLVKLYEINELNSKEKNILRTSYSVLAKNKEDLELLRKLIL